MFGGQGVHQSVVRNRAFRGGRLGRRDVEVGDRVGGTGVGLFVLLRSVSAACHQVRQHSHN
jgi:hypothetical protein